jgi:hypothetical protein
MIKKTIKYIDYDNNQRSEELYFNLSKAELTEMELGTEFGMANLLGQIVETEDVKQIMEILKSIIIKSIGKKSPDGRRFIKSQEIIDNFIQTEAYTELFMELTSDAEQANAFVRGIIPTVNAPVTTNHPALAK